MSTYPVSSNRSYNQTTIDSITDNSIENIIDSWSGFCNTTQFLLQGDLSVGSEFISHVQFLCENRLASLVQDHFFKSLEEKIAKIGAIKFWARFDDYSDISELDESNIQNDCVEQVLSKALEDICIEKQYQEKCLLMLVHGLQLYNENMSEGRHSSDAVRACLFSRYHSMVSSILLTTLPRHFPEILRFYFKERLEELSTMMSENHEDVNKYQAEDEMDTDERTKGSSRVEELDIIDETHHGRRFSENNKFVKSIGKVVLDLRSLGFTSLTNDAYDSSIFLVLKAKVHDLAGEDYRSSVLESIKGWIRAVPLQFLYALLVYLGDSVSYESPSSGLKSPLASHPSSFYQGIDTLSEGLVRWQLRLQYFAYETLQDLRIAKLFEIIVDYPDSSLAIDDLKQCLKYTGQHSKLVDSFISSLRYRLLTAGASTNDILHQYVSTIKALRIIDPTGVFLEAVGEPIKDYLKGRKDTIKCIVTRLTDGPGGNASGPTNSGDSLLEELNRDESQDHAGCGEDISSNEKQAWINAECWEPDPVEADPLKGSRSRRKIDILGMIVGIIGSKDQLINEYHVILAEKLLNKSDYDIDSEIRALELLKIHFGESSMQKCEIMLNDLINSKWLNTNIKASIPNSSQNGAVLNEAGMSLDFFDATIISSNYWPAVQDESIKIPEPMDQLLSDYAKRYNEIKTPRKLMWKKNLGTVKLELQFGDQVAQFTVAPVNAAIIVHFQYQTSWTAKDLAATIGVPVDTLSRRINLWISKGIIAGSVGAEPDNPIFTLVDGMVDNSKNGANHASCEDLTADEEGETSVVSSEEQLQEMTVYEKFITGMLTNFGSMPLDKIHNALTRSLRENPVYDKTLQQLQFFLAGLVAQDVLEFRDELYYLRRWKNE